MSNVLFITETPFNARDYKRFGVDSLIQQGFSVHVFDCTPMIHPILYDKQTLVKKAKNYSYQTIVHSVMFVEHLKLIGGHVTAIPLIKFRLLSYKIFKILSRYEIEYSLFSFPQSPAEAIRAKKSFGERFITNVRSLSISRLQTHAIYRLPLWLLGLSPARYVFCAVDSSNNHLNIIDNRTERCVIHSLDYEIYQEDIEYDDNYYGKIVFLDQSLSIHPDFLIAPVNSLPPKEKYFDEMCGLFESLEKRYAVEVIVSSHPRSDLSLLSKYYKGRKVFKGRTNDLVKNSSFCVAHYSTSINYAVLHNKPLLLVTTSDVEKCSHMQRCINAYASYFNVSAFNISNDVDLSFIDDLGIDENVYGQYKKDFIKSEGSLVGNFWTIVGRKINLLFK